MPNHSPKYPGRRIAYFSMEIALEPDIPTYSGGLGMLAGDTLRAAADLDLPVVGVTLVHRKGYFRQSLDTDGLQHEESVLWRPEEKAELIDRVTAVNIEGRRVQVRAWRYLIRGVRGHVVPVYLLDTAVPENSSWDQTITDHLYGEDQHYRLCQEIVLGMGGLKILRRAGHHHVNVYHMNEGHAALLTLALIEEQLGDTNLEGVKTHDLEEVRSQCVFTTHTPVPAGHDQFSEELTRQVLGRERTAILEVTNCLPNHALNMTSVALRLSRYINGVAMRHGEISQDMFPEYPIHAITNGVHASTWAAPSIQELFNRYIPEWKSDNAYLRYIIQVPPADIRAAHILAKRRLLSQIKMATGARFAEDVFTIGFARRAATYKRLDLIFSNIDRLQAIARAKGRIQLVFAGKAHPRDDGGKALIRKVVQLGRQLQGDGVQVVYIPDYDMNWGRLLTSGVDIWLNTPRKPQEASGTSGMKAALNGVPSLSVLDGWWVEGCIEGVTGWSIGASDDAAEPEEAEVSSLYDKLENQILPIFYQNPDHYAEIMRSAIAINGSFFNTQRMVSQYLANAYMPSNSH